MARVAKPKRGRPAKAEAIKKKAKPVKVVAKAKKTAVMPKAKVVVKPLKAKAKKVKKDSVLKMDITYAQFSSGVLAVLDRLNEISDYIKDLNEREESCEKISRGCFSEVDDSEGEEGFDEENNEED